MELRPALILSVFTLLTSLHAYPWGRRGHEAANRAAVEAIPNDGPKFLAGYTNWIAATGPLPDSWRGVSTPYSKIFEDPNHGWFREQFSFMQSIPRSRYEFVVEVYDEYLRIRKTDPERAQWMNVRWTGALPYAAMENYDRMESAMRMYRKLIADPSPEAKANARFLEQDIAFYMGWLGHYTADGEQPLHDSVQHDGWQGPNPDHYTTDPRIHGRFESGFVDSIQLSDSNLLPLMGKPEVLADPFSTIVQSLGDSSTYVEEIYQMDKRGAFADPKDAQAKHLVTMQLAKAATLLRDLTYTAWVESGKPVSTVSRLGQQGGSCPVPPCGESVPNPIYPSDPAYNPSTGSAPPPGILPRWDSGTGGAHPSSR